jgi:hypothetical protein|tara:strand:+ start:129 stop:329 length:201 start_codon:yes stop_codon:yes gene_type:complete
MANTVQHKRNTSSGQTPSASDLDAGEIAINTADAKLFIKDSSNNIVEVLNGADNEANALALAIALG